MLHVGPKPGDFKCGCVSCVTIEEPNGGPAGKSADPPEKFSTANTAWANLCSADDLYFTGENSAAGAVLRREPGFEAIKQKFVVEEKPYRTTFKLAAAVFDGERTSKTPVHFATPGPRRPSPECMVFLNGLKAQGRLNIICDREDAEAFATEMELHGGFRFYSPSPSKPCAGDERIVVQSLFSHR